MGLYTERNLRKEKKREERYGTIHGEDFKKREKKGRKVWDYTQIGF